MHHHDWNHHFSNAAGRGGPFGRGGPWGRGGRGRPDFSDMFGGPPPRADRGVVRYLVLDAIGQQPRHGYEIIQQIEERSGGTYRPSPGVVYPTLQMLEELGHARVEEHEERKVYAITANGKRELADHAEEVSEFYEDAGEGSWKDMAEDFRDLFGRVGRMFKTVGRAARRGRLNPTTIKKLRIVLDEALAQIEAIVEKR